MQAGGFGGSPPVRSEAASDGGQADVDRIRTGRVRSAESRRSSDLLELENVSKRYGRGSRECVALEDVSLQLDAGELVAVWARRRSGRSTLLRIAAGLDKPDEGIVRFEGHGLADKASESLRGSIRFCRKTFRPEAGQIVLEQLMTGQLTRGVPALEAR